MPMARTTAYKSKGLGFRVAENHMVKGVCGYGILRHDDLQFFTKTTNILDGAAARVPYRFAYRIYMHSTFKIHSQMKQMFPKRL